jgi:hypothetical protein
MDTNSQPLSRTLPYPKQSLFIPFTIVFIADIGAGKIVMTISANADDVT